LTIDDYKLRRFGLPAGIAPNALQFPVMLRGSREVILRKVQPISVHGQISWDVYFTDPDDPDHVSVARVGPETVSHRLEPGDRLRLDYTMGSVVAVHRLAPGA
jgi:regulator of extracellular matrix RemA (YlzA/DUF370 family)